ncbi:hypothetical protein [Halobacterium jilantaiense]|uniref:Uncharacterized protein n=1 Tax=Halobacterium jilantaiense TaxID=355548 RepID=A0A1I0QS91_9EURY|nr:hypothetical protein [Halobacterium jilantaiense]SEW29767.1 hypothetical protein SAMN04487945_2858 [Halobacterium jilantaiense]
MPGDFAARVYLAALGSQDLADAFGEGYETAAEPPAVSGLLRSLSDTHAWATRETDVVADLERGDYVVFHRDWGLRAVGQVWSTTADSDEVARHTRLDDPAGEWGLVTLTNVQPALDHVSLKSLDVDDARRSLSLYRFDDDTAADLRARYTTPARFVEELVANPLAFDVPPGGTPPDRRPESTGRASDSLDLPDTPVDAHLDALDDVRATAFRVLALGSFLLAATLAVVERYRVNPESSFAFTPAVWLGIAGLVVGGALATGVVVHGALRPRPGLPAFTREQTGAVERAGTTDRGADAASHVASTTRAYCAHLHTVTRRVGVATAAATVGVLGGSVYVAYGLAAQVTSAIRPLSPVALVGFPVLCVAAAAYVLAQHSDLPTPNLPSVSVPDVPRPPGVGDALAARLDALRRRLASFAGRLR